MSVFVCHCEWEFWNFVLNVFVCVSNLTARHGVRCVFFYWKDVTLHGCVCVFVCVGYFFYLALKGFFFFLSITTRLHFLLCIYCLSCRRVCLYNKNISNVNCFFFSFLFSVNLVYNQMYIVFSSILFLVHRLAHQMIEKCLHTGFKFLYLNRLLLPIFGNFIYF